MRGHQNFITISDLFDDVLSAMERMDRCCGLGLPSMTYEVYGCSSFPPADISINEDTKNLTFKFAVAGYDEEGVNIDFSDDKMVLTLEKPKSELKGDTPEKETYFNKGIKRSKSVSSYPLPMSKYDVDATEATLKDGILTVKIPAKPEVKAKKVSIKKM